MDSESNYSFVLSEKGKDKLVYSGQVYYFHRHAMSNRTICGSLWVCERKSTMRCPGKARLQDDIVTITKAHNHEPSEVNEQIARYNSFIKRKFEETIEPTNIILSNASAILSPAAITRVPPIHHTKRRGQQLRAKLNGALPDPKDRASIPHIPDKFQVTQMNKPFLRYDSGPESGNDRMLIFSSEEATDMLAECNVLFGDGTFDSAPEIFYQLYVIGVYLRGYVFPCVYALLPGKKKETYIELFRQVSFLTNDKMCPTSFMMDFELAQKQAVEVIFPQAHISACLFHLSQNILKKVQDAHMIKLFRKDQSFSENCKMIAAIAFVPLDEVLNAFETLAAWEGLHEKIDPIMSFFEDSYVGSLQTRKRGRKRVQRKAPHFPQEFWNVHLRITEGLPRSNNHMEAWNKGFKSQIMCENPNIWKLLEALQREESLHHQKLVNVRSGGLAGPKKKKKYLDLDAKLEELATRFDSYDGNYVSYLRDVALTINME